MTSSAWRGPSRSLALASATVLVFVAYGSLLQFEHFGWDTYPLIAASRIQTPSDFVSTFGEVLMDGRYPDGDFYRPVTNLSFALDYAVWGDAARGYHLSNLLILIAACGAIILLAGRMWGVGWGAFVAGLLFALHPLQIEVLPVAARRSDALCVLFTVLALWAQLRSSDSVRHGDSVRASALVGLLSLLAIASKETGAVALPLVFAVRLLSGRAASFADRLRAGFRACWLPGLLVALFVAQRAVVLGGMGGHPESSFSAAWSRAPQQALDTALALLVPQPSDLAAGRAAVLAAAFAAALAAPLALVLRKGRQPFASEAASPLLSGRALLSVLGGWFLVLVWLTSLSGLGEPWYAVPFLAPYALLVGYALHRALAWVREQGGVAPLGSTLLIALVLGIHLYYSPLFSRYGEWPALSKREAAFLAELQQELATLRPGEGSVVRDLPVWQDPLSGVAVRGAAGLAPYSVQAYVELLDDTIPMEVREGSGKRLPIAKPGTRLIEVVPDEG